MTLPRIPQLKNMFTYDILEDFNGNFVDLPLFSNGVFCYNVRSRQWRNYLPNENDSTSLPYNKVISIYEDSKKRLWFMTLGEGFCRYNPETDNFTVMTCRKDFRAIPFTRWSRISGETYGLLLIMVWSASIPIRRASMFIPRLMGC